MGTKWFLVGDVGRAGAEADDRRSPVWSATGCRCGGGTVAVDIGDYAEAGTDKDGKPFERRTRFTHVWVLKDGSWQCVTGHTRASPRSRERQPT
jgi:hypothetical protein